MPAEGVIGDSDSLCCTIAFDPATCDAFSNVARLVVDSIPAVGDRPNPLLGETQFPFISVADDVGQELVDYHAIELALRGRGEQRQLTFQPPAILFPSTLVVGQVMPLRFALCHRSNDILR